MFSYMCISIFSLNRFPNRFSMCFFLPTGRHVQARAERSHGTGPRARPRREGPARDGMPVLPCLAATRVPRSGDRVVVGQGRAGVPSLAGLPRSGDSLRRARVAAPFSPAC